MGTTPLHALDVVVVLAFLSIIPEGNLLLHLHLLLHLLLFLLLLLHLLLR
jgi:hypothetical protein